MCVCVCVCVCVLYVHVCVLERGIGSYRASLAEKGTPVGVGLRDTGPRAGQLGGPASRAAYMHTSSIFTGKYSCKMNKIIIK